MAIPIPIVDTLINGVSNYFSNKQNIKAEEKLREDQIKLAQQKAKLTAIENGQKIESDYDIKVLEAAKSTWIDEVMIIWVLCLVTCLFIPSLAPFAIGGFTALGQVPLWFQTVFVGCFISKLGLRFLFSGRSLFGSRVK